MHISSPLPLLHQPRPLSLSWLCLFLGSVGVSFTPLTSLWPFLLEILGPPCWERPAAPDPGQVSILYLRFSVSRASATSTRSRRLRSPRRQSQLQLHPGYRNPAACSRSFARSLGQLKNNTSSSPDLRSFSHGLLGFLPYYSPPPSPCLSFSLVPFTGRVLLPHGNERDTRGEIQKPVGAAKGPRKNVGSKREIPRAVKRLIDDAGTSINQKRAPSHERQATSRFTNGPAAYISTISESLLDDRVIPAGPYPGVDYPSRAVCVGMARKFRGCERRRKKMRKSERSVRNARLTFDIAPREWDLRQKWARGMNGFHGIRSAGEQQRENRESGGREEERRGEIDREESDTKHNPIVRVQKFATGGEKNLARLRKQRCGDFSWCPLRAWQRERPVDSINASKQRGILIAPRHQSLEYVTHLAARHTSLSRSPDFARDLASRGSCGKEGWGETRKNDVYGGGAKEEGRKNGASEGLVIPVGEANGQRKRQMSSPARYIFYFAANVCRIRRERDRAKIFPN